MQGVLRRWSHPWRLCSTLFARPLPILPRPRPLPILPCPRPLQFTIPRRPLSTSGAPSPTPRIELREYQLKCVIACIDALESGLTRIGASLPTGSGKTPVFLSLIPLVRPPPDRPGANRVIIIVTSEEIANQVLSHARSLLPDLTVELEQGWSHASGEADMYVPLLSTCTKVLTVLFCFCGSTSR